MHLSVEQAGIEAKGSYARCLGVLPNWGMGKWGRAMVACVAGAVVEAMKPRLGSI